MLAAAAVPASAQTTVAYQTHIRKLLKERCVNCHNARRARAGLDLSSYPAIRAGSDTGEVVVAGAPEDSYLYLVVAHEEEPSMPPGSQRLPEDEVQLIRDWIAQGLLEEASPEPAALSPADAPDEPQSGTLFLPAVDARLSVDKSHFATNHVFVGDRGTAIRALAANERGLVAVGGQLQVLVYDLNSRELLQVLPYPEGEPQVLRFLDGPGWLLAGGGVHAESGGAVVWEVDSWRRLYTLGDELDVALALDATRGGRLVVLGGPERLVRIFETTSGSLVHELDKHTDWVLAAAFSPEEFLLSTSDRAGNLFVWETESGALLHNLRGHVGAVVGLAWCTDGDRLLSAGEDGSVRMWDMHQGEQIRSWTAHAEGVASLVLAPNEQVYTVGRDQSLRRWSLSGESLAPPIPLDSAPLAAAVDGQGRVIVSNWRGEVLAWNSGDEALGGLSPPPEFTTTDVAMIQPTPEALVEVGPRTVAVEAPTAAVLASEKDLSGDDPAEELAAAIERLESSRSAIQIAWDQLHSAEQAYLTLGKGSVRIADAGEAPPGAAEEDDFTRRRAVLAQIRERLVAITDLIDDPVLGEGEQMEQLRLLHEIALEKAEQVVHGADAEADAARATVDAARVAQLKAKLAAAQERHVQARNRLHSDRERFNQAVSRFAATIDSIEQSMAIDDAQTLQKEK